METGKLAICHTGRRCGIAALALGLVLAFAVPAIGGEKKWPDKEGYWLPERASTYAEEIDGLWDGILYLTGFVFFATELLLVYCLFKYRHNPARKSIYTHGNHKLEMVWTLIPALILFIIAIVQKGTWDKIKSEALLPKGKDVVQVQNFAEQFSWNFRYPGKDGKYGTKDDIYTVKQLYVPVNRPVIIEQTSKDVIHSLFLPYMRVKQDAVPGMQIKVWFQATKTTKEMQSSRPPAKVQRTRIDPGPDNKAGTQDDKPVVSDETIEWNYEIVCAELCGIQHAQMRGEMYVLEQKEFDEWVAKESKLFEDGDKEPTADKLWPLWKVNPETGVRVYDEPKKEPAKKEH